MTSRHKLSDHAMEAAIDAYSWAAECDRREAERNQPVPVCTIRVLLTFACAVYLIGLTIFGPGAF